MRVLHLLASNKFSGAENVVCQIMDIFKEDVEMVYCSPNGQISQSLAQKGIKYIPLNKLTKQEVSKVVKSYKPDIIHAHDVRASVVASKFYKNAKIISHIHGNDKRNMSRITIKSLLYSFACKRFSKIYWVSESCLNDYYFKNKVNKKSNVLYNIININKIKQAIKEDDKTYNYQICCLGRLCEVKNPLRALNILKEVVKVKPDIKCAIIGDGELREVCEDFVKNNNLSSNIDFLGFKSNPYKIVEQSRCLLMSSINEGTPMAVLEAFSLGIPLVSTKVDGAVEIVKNDKMGYLYTEDDVAVKSILKIIENDKEYYKEYLINFSKEYNDIEKYKKTILEGYRG